MAKEIRLSEYRYQAPLLSAHEILGIVDQIRCVANSATVLRCCNSRYNLTKAPVAYESVSAHTNLCQALVDRALSYWYGPNSDRLYDGYTYREIMEAIRRHDLPENVIGDIADNGTRDDASLAVAEHSYLRQFAKNSPSYEYNGDYDTEDTIAQLLHDMEEKDGFLGQLLYSADKSSAIIHTLECDAKGMSPFMTNTFKQASQKEKAAMDICDYYEELPSLAGHCKKYRASEIWSIDYFRFRKLWQYDVTRLMTAIIVMQTLVINDGKWYTWREADYNA